MPSNFVEATFSRSMSANQSIARDINMPISGLVGTRLPKQQMVDEIVGDDNQTPKRGSQRSCENLLMQYL